MADDQGLFDGESFAIELTHSLLAFTFWRLRAGGSCRASPCGPAASCGADPGGRRPHAPPRRLRSCPAAPVGCARVPPPPASAPGLVILRRAGSGAARPTPAAGPAPVTG